MQLPIAEYLKDSGILDWPPETAARKSFNRQPTEFAQGTALQVAPPIDAPHTINRHPPQAFWHRLDSQ
jgi:hypothetical protein